MNLKWSWVFLSIIISINGQSESEIESDVQLTELGYEEVCKSVGEAEWSFLKEPNDTNVQAWKNSKKEFADYARTEKEAISAMSNGTLENELLHYKISLITSPGDFLMEPEDLEKMLLFVEEAEMTIMLGNKTHPDRSLRERTEWTLAKNSSANEKLEAWKNWYRNLTPLTSKFSENLKLLEKAALANGMKSVSDYWAMLSDYAAGYEEMESIWTRISPLHAQLMKFVQTRLGKKYSDYNFPNETLPAHLLGSLQGYDWTQLALHIVPFPNTTFEVRKNLLDNHLVGENLYKSASRLGKILLKKIPEAEFWKKSDFHGQCPSHLINLCSGDMRMMTCSNQSSIRSYIDAHKDVASILIHQMAMNTPILSETTRYSAVELGVEELFGVLSMSRAWLLSLNILNESDDPDEIRVLSLMITALDILPRMAYYITADTWRLNSIRNKAFDPEKLTANWWKDRTSYELISTSTPEPTFLFDDHIISNKPYLPKFLSVLLGFQIYEELMLSTEMRYDQIGGFTPRPEFLHMIQYGTGSNWTSVIREYLNIYEISADSLLKYFSPLEDYLNEVEDSLDPTPAIFENTLTQMEDKLRKSDLPKSAAKVPPAEIPTTEKTEKIEKTVAPPLKPSSDPPKIQEKSAQPPPKVPELEKTIHNPDEQVKAGTSKAVWAVGAVLIAIVTIVIITIFGRQRCRKTPKNRRYV